MNVVSQIYNKSLYRFNVCCLYIILLWTALSSLILHIDGHGRVTMSAVIGCALINTAKNIKWRKIITSGPTCIWLIWCLYATANLFAQGMLDNPNVDSEYDRMWDQTLILNVFRQVVVMGLCVYLYLTDPKRLIVHAIICFATIGILTLAFDSVNYDWGGEVRFGIVMGNSAALTMVSLTAITAIAWIKRYIKGQWCALLLLLAITIIFMVQTRKAFVSIAIILLFSYIAKAHIKKTTDWIKFGFVIFILYYFGNYILDNTEIGQRFSNMEEKNEKFEEQFFEEIPIYLKFLGDRAIQVLLGWEIWKENPWFGVGLGNAPVYSGLPFVFHNEYIGQLSEQGVIGIGILICFYIAIILRLVRRISLDRNAYGICMVSLGSVVAILVISLTAWTYQFEHYFVVLGILTAEGFSKKTTNKYGLSKNVTK